MKIKVRFEQKTSITVTDKVTATCVSSHFESIKLVSAFYLLSIDEIVKYYKALGKAEEDTKFGFTDCWGHCTYQYNTLEELKTATAGYIERAEKEIEFKAEFFRNRITLQPLEKTEEELKANAELVRSFGE